MIKTLFLISLIANLIFLYFLSNSNEQVDGDWVVASPSEKKCLSDSKQNRVVLSHEIFGPDNLSNRSLVLVQSDYSQDSFEYKYSNCFYSAISKTNNENEIANIVAIFNLEGYEHIGIYKDPYKSEISIIGLQK